MQLNFSSKHRNVAVTLPPLTLFTIHGHNSVNKMSCHYGSQTKNTPGAKINFQTCLASQAYAIVGNNISMLMQY